MSAVSTTEAVARAEPSYGARTARIFLKHIALFLGLMAAWQAASASGLTNPLLFPEPTRILESMYRVYFIQGNVWYHLYVTFAEAMVGCFVGSVIGMGLAISAALNDTFRDYLKPYVILIEATPRIAVGPIFIAWLGFGFSSKVALAALVCFFAPFVNTLTGLLNVDEEADELFRSMGASKWQRFWKLMVPNAMPLIMAGLKLAIASAFAGALVAEFISANEGMGVLLYRYTFALNMPSAFACLLSITAYGYLLFRTTEVIEHYVLYWRSDELMLVKGRKRAVAWRKESEA